LQLQVSAQTYDQKISDKDEVSVLSKVVGKTSKSNKLGAFAKVLDGSRVKAPQNGAVIAGAEFVDNDVQQLAWQKKTSKTAQNQKIPFVTEQMPTERKKKNFSHHQQEMRGIEALFVHKVKENSSGKSGKTATSPSGVEQVKKEVFVNTPVDGSKAVSEQVQETILSVTSARNAKNVVASPLEMNVAESPTKTDRQKKEISPIAGEIPHGETVEQTTRLKEIAVNQQMEKTEGESKVSKTKRKDRFSVEVHDARSVDTATAQEKPLQVNAVHPDADTAELSIDLSHGRAQDSPEVGSPDKVYTSRNFTDMLSHVLGDTLSNDIVRQAAIILRDGGQGTIRLSLKPETLGSVKIRLELAENKITGNIIVDSEEAYRAFEKEVHTLEQAFKDSGFESANLNATFASGDDSNGRQWDDSERQYFSERLIAERYDALTIETMPSLGSGYEPEQRDPVNIFA
jgi:flagellar hook-length control protein FliK